MALARRVGAGDVGVIGGGRRLISIVISHYTDVLFHKYLYLATLYCCLPHPPSLPPPGTTTLGEGHLVTEGNISSYYFIHYFIFSSVQSMHPPFDGNYTTCTKAMQHANLYDY